MEDVIDEKQQGAPVMEVEEAISVNDRKSPFQRYLSREFNSLVPRCVRCGLCRKAHARLGSRSSRLPSINLAAIKVEDFGQEVDWAALLMWWS